MTKCYIIVVTWALVVYLIYTPSALGLRVGLRVYISDKPLLPMLQLYSGNHYAGLTTVLINSNIAN